MTDSISSVSSTSEINASILSQVAASTSSSSTTQSTDEIVREIKMNSTASNETVDDIMDDYGVSRLQAQEIYESITEEEENTMPDYSTFSTKA